MKTLILSLTILCAANCFGNQADKSDQVGSTGSGDENIQVEQKPQSIVDILEPQSPQSPQSHQRITFQQFDSVSLATFLHDLKNRWTAVYHCNGHPISLNDIPALAKEKRVQLLSNGMMPKIEYEFDGTEVRRYIRSPSANQSDSQLVLDKAARYSVESLGSGQFRMNYTKDTFYTNIQHFVKVNETGEIGIEYDGENKHIPCDKQGHTIKTIEILLQNNFV